MAAEAIHGADSRWQTSNSAYGSGVVKEQQLLREQRYASLNERSKNDEAIAVSHVYSPRRTTSPPTPTTTPPQHALHRENVETIAAVPQPRAPDQAVPEETVALRDWNQLQDRLADWSLREVQVEGDGACQVGYNLFTTAATADGAAAAAATNAAAAAVTNHPV